MHLETAEINKFSEDASVWWDIKGPYKTLHTINPTRLIYITKHASLTGKTVLDIGCGGGILTESLAQHAKKVVGIDENPNCILAATEHAKLRQLDIHYLTTTTTIHAKEYPAYFDIITCMELLEHVTNPKLLIENCKKLLRPGGQIFFSTINRSLKSYTFAILLAEHICKILPKNTHDYKKFIRPSELSQACYTADLIVEDIAGLQYIPGLNQSYLSQNPAINYLLYAKKCQQDEP